MLNNVEWLKVIFRRVNGSKTSFTFDHGPGESEIAAIAEQFLS
jgi:hypothetical protein